MLMANEQEFHTLIEVLVFAEFTSCTSKDFVTNAWFFFLQMLV